MIRTPLPTRSTIFNTKHNRRQWTHRKSTRKDSIRKRWYFHKKRRINRKWTNQTTWRRSKTWEYMTHFRMPVKQQMTSGPCQEASKTAITLNPESNFTRREKNHSLFHWNTLMYPELLIRNWMSSKRDASMTIGISMGQERLFCSMYKFHSICSCGRKTSRKNYVNKKTTHIEARSFAARTLRGNGEERQAEGEAKVVEWKTPSGERTEIARSLASTTKKNLL